MKKRIMLAAIFAVLAAFLITGMIVQASSLEVPSGANVTDPGAMEVDIDIKPGSYPNPINVKSRGVVPVAIFGTEAFDVGAVDPVSVALTYPRHVSVSPSVSPLRWNWDDVNGDGFMDIVFHFGTQELIPLTMTHEPDRAEMVLRLTGSLIDGMPIAGEDTVVVINKGYNGF